MTAAFERAEPRRQARRLHVPRCLPSSASTARTPRATRGAVASSTTRTWAPRHKGRSSPKLRSDAPRTELRLARIVAKVVFSSRNVYCPTYGHYVRKTDIGFTIVMTSRLRRWFDVPKADPAARPTRCRTGQHRGAVRSLRRSAVPRGTTRRSREAAGEHDAHPYRQSTFGGGEEPSARHRVGPWIPVTPVDLVPSLAGGDTMSLSRSTSSASAVHA